MVRVQAQHLAGRPHGAGDRDRGLVEHHAHAGGHRDLVERGGEASPRRVAEDVDVGLDVEHGGDQAVERLRVGRDLDLELQAFANAHDRDAVQADRAGQDEGVPD